MNRFINYVIKHIITFVITNFNTYLCSVKSNNTR